MLLTTKIALSDEQREYLEGLGVDTKIFNSIENEKYEESNLDVNTLIKVLFTCSKYEDAWNTIKNEIKKEKVNVNFSDIFTCPYAQLDREAIEVYKYMYDNNIVDKKSYMYFEVLSGKLNDWEFWKNEFEGKTTTQILNILNDSFNDIFAQENVNPYQVGLVTLTEEQNKYIFIDRIENGEKIDFIFDNKPCINVELETIVFLLTNDNLDKSLASRYFKILLEGYTHMFDINDPDNMDKYNNFWEYVFNYTNEKLVGDVEGEGIEYTFIKLVKDIELDSLPKLLNFCNVLHSWDDNWETKKDYYEDHNIDFSNTRLDVCINNPLMLNYPYTILNEGLYFPYNDNVKKINVAQLLDNKNLGMALSYQMNNAFDTSDFIIKYPFPAGCPMIYSKITDHILIGNKEQEYSKELFGFVDDYNIAGHIDEELFKNFNSEEEFKEFILSVETFTKTINEFRDEIL